jgi:SAM-dependent methyltransferase
MPIARFQAPDGRIMRFEVPEGTSEEDLFAAAQKQLGISTDVDFDDPLAVDIIKGLGSGAVQAIANTAAGLQSATATALGDDPDNKFLQGLQSNAEKIRDFSIKVDKRIGLDRDFAESLPGQIAKGFGQMPVNIAATVGGAAVGSLAGPGGTVAGGLIGGGLTMAGQMQTEAIMDAERTLKKKHADFTEEEKDKTAVSSLSYMTLGTIMEYAGLSKVVPKPLKKKVLNFLNKKGTLSAPEVSEITKSLKGEVLRGAAFEGMTEAAQGQLLDGLAAATYDTDREQFTVNQLGNRFNEFVVGSVVGGGTTAVLGGADRLMSGEPLSGRKATEAVADETIQAQSPFTFEYQRLDFEGQPQTESGPISAATEEEARSRAVEILQRDKDADVDSLIIKPVIEVGTFQDIQNQKVESRFEDTTLSNQERIQAYYESLTDEELERIIEKEKKSARSLEQYRSLPDEVNLTKIDEYEAELIRQEKSYEGIKKNAERAKAVLQARRGDPGSVGARQLQSEVEPGVDPTRAQTTQRANTKATYQKVKKLLKDGVTLDFGAGLGIGGEVLEADTFEPFPQGGFEPNFLDAEAIPSSSYDNVTNLNTLNVVPRDIRDGIVRDIGRVLKPGGQAIITTRPKADVLSTKNAQPASEEGAIITGTGSFQKGFTPKELKEYVSDVLGDEYTVTALGSKKTGIGVPTVRIEKSDTSTESGVTTEQAALETEAEHGTATVESLDGDDIANAVGASRGINYPNSQQITRESLRGKKVFPFFADRTRVGTYTGIDPDSGINIPLQGGPGYPFIAENAERGAGWAFSDKGTGVYTSVNNKVNDPSVDDGIGVVALQAYENHRGNQTFLKAYMAEVDYAINKKKLKKKDFFDEVNALRQRALNRKVRGKPYIGEQSEARPLFSKEWKTLEQVEEALGATNFDVRGNAFFGYSPAPKKGSANRGTLLGKDENLDKGFPDITQILDLMVDPQLKDLKYGDVVAAVQFEKGQGKTPIDASELGVPTHLSYPKVMKGRGIGGFSDVVNIVDLLELESNKKDKALQKRLIGKEDRLRSMYSTRQPFAVAAKQPTRSEAQTFDRIREFERAQAKMLGKEYIPSSDAALMRQLEGTRISQPYERFVGASTTAKLTPETLNVIGKPMMQIKKLANKLNIEIVEAESLPENRDAQYNYEDQRIEYVPELLAGRGTRNAMAAMREEVIHAAMHQVILRKAKDLTPRQAFVETMNSIGNALTTQQRERISQVYGKELSLTDAGAEYTRFVVQQMLYGETTESTMLQGPAFEKVKSLLRAIHSFVTRALKGDLQTNDEVAQIIKNTADLVAAADPSARLPYQKQVNIANQKVVEQQGQGTLTADNIADPTEVDPEKIVREREKIFGKMALKDFFYTPSRILQDISPKLYEVFQVWQQAIASKTLDAKQLAQPFFSKLEGIKNTQDKEKLYRYLAFSPTQEEAGTTESQSIIRERNRLMEKYDLYNEFNLIVRPLFNRIYEERKGVGMEEGFLFEYFPRVIKDMTSYLAYLGNDIRNDFKTYLSEVNAKRNEDNKASIDINTPLAGVIYGDYIKSDRYKKLKPKLSSAEQRKVSFIDEDAMKYYYTPAESFVRYVDSSYKAIENTKLLGNISGTNLSQTGLEQALANKKEIGRLGQVIMELAQDPNVDQTRLFFEVPYIANTFITPSSNPTVDPFGYLNSAMYGALMIEPTSTLSNAYELAFATLDNGIRPTIAAMLGRKTMTLDEIGVDKRQFSAEYNPDAKGLQKLVATGLELTGFRRMDQFIKESTLTANYNRYRRAALKAKNSSEYKKLVAEIDFRMPSFRDKIIYDLRNNTPRSPEVRAFLFTKLAETQPISDLEMPAIVKKSPAARTLYVMKTFIIKQANFVFQRYFSVMANPQATPAERAKAVKDFGLLLVYFVMIGVPIDALKDLVAGRDKYPSDYITNSLIRVFGISKYSAYEFKRDPKAMVMNYFAPVSFQVPLDVIGQLQAFYDDESKGKPETLIRYGPFTDLVYYRYGPGKESQARKRYKKSLEGEFPVELLNF